MHGQSMASSSLPMNLILVTGERGVRNSVSQLKEGDSPGQKMVEALLFPQGKRLLPRLLSYHTGSGALKYYFSML